MASCIVLGGRKEWWLRLTVGWASSHSRVGEACCLQQACPPKRLSCFRIDLEINVQ